MQPFLRPVSVGLILGIISLFFGIFWAVNLTVNHEKIHRRLSDSAASVIKDKFVINSEGGHDHSMHTETSNSHDHGGPGAGHDHSMHDHDMTSGGHNETAASAAPEKSVHEHGGHTEPWMEAAHERLGRGHLHAMGLGLLSICVSLILSFLKSPDKVKTFASASVGIGGFFYPLAWIIMGFRTPVLGIEGAQESVFPIAAFSILLVFLGIIITLFYLIKGLARRA